jgi:SAM-dependent methyltransferase
MHKTRGSRHGSRTTSHIVAAARRGKFVFHGKDSSPSLSRLRPLINQLLSCRATITNIMLLAHNRGLRYNIVGRPLERSRHVTIVSSDGVSALIHDTLINHALQGVWQKMKRGRLLPPVAAKGSIVILNLGCGTKTSSECINIDWSWWLRIARNPIMKALAPVFLDSVRMNKLNEIASQPILVHDLRNGIPYPDNTVDAVYHSHVIEHIDRSSVEAFMREVRRVLKPGGIQRIVAPDLEALARSYLADLISDPPSVEWQAHDAHISDMIEQMVRRDSGAIKGLPSFRRFLDIAVRGDARRRGETHQWMYDRVNLPGLLDLNGFRDIRILDYRTSMIPGWESAGLDLGPDGREEYKPGSIYIECAK